jgi:hypothetical protein
MIDEFIQAYGCNYRKARKDHKCCECRGVIRKGEHYFYHHGVLDGRGCDFKVCEDCGHLKEEIDSHIKDPYERVAFGELYMYVFEDDDISLMQRYINLKQKRNADIPQWMLDKVRKIEAQRQNESVREKEQLKTLKSQMS